MVDLNLLKVTNFGRSHLSLMILSPNLNEIHQKLLFSINFNESQKSVGKRV